MAEILSILIGKNMREILSAVQVWKNNWTKLVIESGLLLIVAIRIGKDLPRGEFLFHHTGFKIVGVTEFVKTCETTKF